MKGVAKETTKADTGMRYPHSASLFRFCRQVLDRKHGGIRVIDQDVGQILGFDPADCSHWKKGKKNIKSIQAIRSIATHLGVDEKLIVDLATGDISESEAFFEYHGYGSCKIDARLFETIKKEHYQKDTGVWTREHEQRLRSYLTADREKVAKAVSAIHQKINFSEAPLYLPEITSHYPEIAIVQTDEMTTEQAERGVSVEESSERYTVKYHSGREMKPYLRFQIAKALAARFLPETHHRDPSFDEYKEHIHDVESNLFAAMLMAPADMVRAELEKIDVTRDIVTQLAEQFWVSKNFINQRLRDILSEG